MNKNKILKQANQFPYTLQLSMKLFSLLLVLGLLSVTACNKTDGTMEEVTPNHNTPELTDKYYITGNRDADLVIINTQGGPSVSLFTTEFVEVFSAVDLTKAAILNVHQAQTLNPDLFANQQITFEEAIDYGKQTTALLAEVVQDFKNQGKKVYVTGFSYGAFAVADLLATQGNIADGYLLQAGRLDMPAEVWEVFSMGMFAGFESDGVTVVNFNSAEEAGMEGPGLYTSENLAKIAAAFGHKRYTELLDNLDLSNTTYIYGQADEQVGRLSDAEVTFLTEHGADVKPTPGGHGSELMDQLTNETLRSYVGN